MRSLQRTTCLAALLLHALAGCAEDAHRADFVVTVTDEDVAARVAFVEVRIRRGGCGGEILYDEGFRPGSSPPAPPLLSRGTWGFEARARDVDCNAIAFACVELSLPRDETIEVPMAPISEGADCAPEACDRGVCGASACDGGACDAGTTCDGGACACDGGVCPNECAPYPQDRCPACEPLGFSRDLVDPDVGRGQNVALAADPSGGLHATYYDSSLHRLVYAEHAPEGYWVDAVVDSADAAGALVDIEVDGMGGAHAAYLEESARDVLYAYRAPGETTWSTRAADAEGELGESVSLAVEEDGTAHVVSVEQSMDVLRYARASLGASFVAETVAIPALEPVREAAVGVDGSGRAHVVYRTERGPVHYASRAPDGAWTFEDLPLVGTFDRNGENVAVAVETDGTVHAVFHPSSERQLAYAQRSTEGVWSTYVVDPSDRVRGEIGVAVGSTGDVHVTYFRDDGSDLYYVRRDASGGWTAPVTVATDGSAGEFNDVTVDDEGAVHVAFADASRRDLLYATRAADGSWVIETAAFLGDVGLHAAIAVDRSGLLHLAHQSAGDRDLHVACKRPGGSWDVEVMDDPDATTFGDASAVAVDAAGSIHVAYLDAATQRLRAAHREASGAFTVETIDPGPNAGRAVSLLAGADGSLHAAYLAGDTVSHAVRPPGGSWSVDRVNTERADAVALALDASSVPHVAYHSQEGSGARYATRSGGTWLVSTIDATRSDRGQHIALAIAADGTVHAAYQGGGALYHAELAAGASLDAWSAPEVVDAADENGDDLALALDLAGAPHVAYAHGVPIIDSTTGGRTGTDYDLRYAVRSPTEWTVQTLDPTDDAGQHVAITIDASDRVHVVYRSTQGVRHAWTLP